MVVLPLKIAHVTKVEQIRHRYFRISACLQVIADTGHTPLCPRQHINLLLPSLGPGQLLLLTSLGTLPQVRRTVELTEETAARLFLDLVGVAAPRV